MIRLEDQLKSIDKEKNKILSKIKRRNKRRKIKCASCKNSHEIGKLKAIQTHWYVTPRGCNAGDYWKEGELQFICPETNVANRLLFDNTDVEWEERDKYGNNPEEQFKTMYKGLFNEVKDVYDESSPRGANNYYVDQNRKKFGLVEKKK